MTHLPQDALAILLSILYVGACVGASELVRKRRGYGTSFPARSST